MRPSWTVSGFLAFFDVDANVEGGRSPKRGASCVKSGECFDRINIAVTSGSDFVSAQIHSLRNCRQTPNLGCPPLNLHFPPIRTQHTAAHSACPFARNRTHDSARTLSHFKRLCNEGRTSEHRGIWLGFGEGEGEGETAQFVVRACSGERVNNTHTLMYSSIHTLKCKLRTKLRAADVAADDVLNNASGHPPL